MFARDGKVYDHDDGVRPDTTVEKLAELKPAFERPYGKVTAGNSSQITDGASWVILASEDGGEAARPQAARRDRRQPMGGARSVDHGARPGAVRRPRSCSRHGLALGDIGLWELNEAFAAQVLACLAAWEDDDLLPRGAAVSTAPRAASRATSSTSTAAPSGSAIRSAPAATASCCISSTR